MRPHDGTVRNPALFHRDVQQAVGQHGIGARRDLEVQGRRGRSRRETRIDHNEGSPALLLLLKILHDRRHGFREIAAHEENGLRLREIWQRKRQASVDAERFDGSRGGRRHTEPAVVIDLRSAQGDTRKLA